MLKISTLTSRARLIGTAGVLAGVSLLAALQPMLVSADQVTSRSLSLTSSAPGSSNVGAPGSATNGARAGYTFSFTGATGNFQSFSVVFCTSAFGYTTSTGSPRPVTSGTSGTVGDTHPCAVPAGMTALQWNNATTPVVRINGSTTGAGSGWSAVVNNNRQNVILITATAATTAVTSGDTITVEFPATATNYITNPTDNTYDTDYSDGVENTFFGHMTTYSDAAYATSVDDGTVASAITQSIGITAKVQETLKFSVGTTPTTPNVSCDALGGTNTLTMGDANGVLSTARAYDAHSYFRLSTNAINGTAIQYAGNTLAAGAQTITGIGATGTISTPNTEQFGLGVDSGDLTANGYSLTDLIPDTDYAQADGDVSVPSGNLIFAFDPAAATAPVTLAASAVNDIVECETGSVRYVANIDNNTAAGIYRTTINYIAVPKY